MSNRIGVDESGKGDYFGYLVVAAVYVDDKNEDLLKKHLDNEDLVFHTEMKGSPFFILKDKG